MESIKVFFSYGLLTIHICFHACSGSKFAGLQLIHSMTINYKNRKRNNLSENNWDANLPSITALLLYCRLTSNYWNIKTEIKKRVSFALFTAFTVLYNFHFSVDILDVCRFPFLPFDPFGPAGPCFPGGPGGPTRPFPGFCICWPKIETRRW